MERKITGGAARGVLAASLFLATFLGSAKEGNAIGEATPPAAASSINIPPNTIGEQRALVLLANSNLDRSEPITKDRAREIMFGQSGETVNNFIREVSYGKTWFSGDAGDVKGYFSITINTADCNAGSYMTQVDEQARRAGVSLSSYRRIVYAINGTPCGSGATFMDGNPISIRSGVFDLTNLMVWIHEVAGHNMGIMHATALECPGGVSIDSYTKCGEAILEKDIWDVMGTSTWVAGMWPFGFNGPHRAALGFIPPANIREITKEGNYTIRNVEEATSDTQLLKIKKQDTNEYYYLSFRKAVGFFDSSLPSSFTSGTSIHKWNDDPRTNTMLLDSTPTSSSRFYDAPLTDGSTFRDPSNSLEVTQVSHNSSEVVVQITSPALRPHLSAAITGPSVLQPGEAPTFAASFSSDTGAPSVGDIWLYRLDGRPITASCLWSMGPLCRAWTINFTNTTPFTAVNLPNRLEPGDYLGFGMVYDSSGPKCSGAYEILGGDWLDCGDRDVFTLKVL